MRTIHRSSLTVLGGDMAALVRVHAEWILGFDRFVSLRASRLAGGVPETTTVAELLAQSGPTWRGWMRLVEGGRLRWRSQIEIGRSDDGVVVDHVVTCDEAVEQGVDAPEVVYWILDECESVAPEGLAPCGVLEVDGDEAEGLVDRLLDPEREAPIVAVAVDNSRREPLVDVFELARRLAGMAEVVSLMTVEASFRLRDVLVARGLSEKFGCYHGAARIYWPGLAVGDDPYDHPLFLRQRIVRPASDRRTEECADRIGELLVEDEYAGVDQAPPAAAPVAGASAPSAGLRLSDFLRTGEPLGAAMLARLWPPRPPQPQAGAKPGPERDGAATERGQPQPASAPAPEQTRGALVYEVVRLRGELAKSNQALAASQAELGAAKRELAARPRGGAPQGGREDETAHLRSELRKLRESLAAAQGELTTAKEEIEARRPDEEVLEELASEVNTIEAEAARRVAEEKRLRRRAEQERDEATALLGSPRSVGDAVALSAALFPEQLVILKSARASAEASAYREPGRVFSVLCVLGLVGSGDVGQGIGLIFGNAARWKPKDSPETARAFGAQRTWAGEDGKAKLFTRHVTLGHGLDARGCLQIYYDVLADGRVEVAWVGEHRPTVSVDT